VRGKAVRPLFSRLFLFGKWKVKEMGAPFSLGGKTMDREELESNEDECKVVVNHEEQYSIWPAHRENALGWRDAGKSGSKEECLAYVKEVWTDMRPLSLRQKMAAQ